MAHVSFCVVASVHPLIYKVTTANLLQKVGYVTPRQNRILKGASRVIGTLYLSSNADYLEHLRAEHKVFVTGRAIACCENRGPFQFYF